MLNKQIIFFGGVDVANSFHSKSIVKKKRINFAKIKDIIDPPNLIEIQKKSFNWFIEDGIKNILKDVSPIEDLGKRLILEFISHKIEKPNRTIEEAIEKDLHYDATFKVLTRLIFKDTGEVKEEEVFLGNYPLITPNGSFVINGVERVVVSQLVRSPGIYFTYNIDSTGDKIYKGTIIPHRGAWIEFENDTQGNIFVRIDRARKLPVTVLLKCLNFKNNDEIKKYFNNNIYITRTLKKDSTNESETALIELFRKLRPGEPPSKENAKNLLYNLFSDKKRYDLDDVGRYKINKKLKQTRK